MIPFICKSDLLGSITEYAQAVQALRDSSPEKSPSPSPERNVVDEATLRRQFYDKCSNFCAPIKLATVLLNVGCGIGLKEVVQGYSKKQKIKVFLKT